MIIMNLQKTQYELFMREALVCAQQACEEQEVPIGAVIIDKEGTIIARAYNQIEQYHSQTAHAELLAISQAGKYHGDWRLDECTIIVTLEPCSMCMAAIKLSRIRTVVYGADSPIFGFKLDNNHFLPLYNKDALTIIKGVLELECSEILKQFFRGKRRKHEACKGESS